MINIEKYKGKIIFDKCIEYLFLHAKNVYWFINDYSMYEDLTELLNHSDECVFVLIG